MRVRDGVARDITPRQMRWRMRGTSVPVVSNGLFVIEVGVGLPTVFGCWLAFPSNEILATRRRSAMDDDAIDNK